VASGSGERDISWARFVCAGCGDAGERGTAAREHCREISDPVLLAMDFAKAPLSRGEVIYVDHYGNAVTNVKRELIQQAPAARVAIGGVNVGPVRETYSDVAGGQAVAVIGSSGLMEIAVRNGSAARELKIRVGDVVQFV